MARPSEGSSCRIQVPRFELECEVARHVVMKVLRIRRHRIFIRGDDGEIAVFDVDELAGIVGNRSRLRDDHCDRLADVTHAPEREHGMMHFANLLPALARIIQGVGQRLEAGFAHVFAS